jgi:hypothetical protein
MVQRGDEAGLGGEAGPHPGVLAQVRGQLLDGHRPPQLAVAGAPHDPPGAAPELVFDVVGVEELPDLVCVNAHIKLQIGSTAPYSRRMPTGENGLMARA